MIALKLAIGAGGEQTLTQRAIAILRRPSIEAHVYLPGATQTSYGVELFSGAWTTSDTYNNVTTSVDSSSLTVSPATTPSRTSKVFATVAGRTYILQKRILSSSLTASVFVRDGSVSGAGTIIATYNPPVGQTSALSFVATSTFTNVLFSTANAASYVIDNISVREVITSTVVLSGLQAANYLDSAGTTLATVDNPVGGVVDAIGSINATQPTTAAKPILRQTAGKYSWAFDGGDSLSLGSVPFQLSDDFAVIAAANIPTTKAEASTLFSSGDTVSAIGYCSLDVSTSGVLRGIFKDSIGIQDTPTYSTNVTGSSFVASITKVGNLKSLRYNGVVRATASTALSATTFNSTYIGARTVTTTPTNNALGSTGPIIAIKGALTDSEMLTLERFVSALTPNGPTF